MKDALGVVTLIPRDGGFCWARLSIVIAERRRVLGLACAPLTGALPIFTAYCRILKFYEMLVLTLHVHNQPPQALQHGDPEKGGYNVLVEILLLTATAARQRSSGQMVQARKREGLPCSCRLQAYSTQ